MAEASSLDDQEEFEEPKYFVRVTGFSTNTTQDALLNFFENARRSGGGEIKDIQFNYEEGFADIIFCSNNDAERCVQKTGLQLDGASLITTLKPIPKELPKDHKRLHVMDISDRTIRDGLLAFMEVVSGKKVESILFGDNSNCVVSFMESIDYHELQRLCKTCSLDGSFLNVEEVIMCDAIEVSGFTENTTQDTISYYFRNKRNGGGDVKSINTITEGRVVLSFEDPRVVDTLFKQDHIIDDVHIVINRYYPFLGETSLKHPKREKRERTVQVDPQNMLFIEEFFHQEFNHLLQESQVKYTWQQGSGEIVLGYAEPKMDKKTWENSCEAVVTYINQIVSEKITVSREIWEQMSDEMIEKCAGLGTQMQISHVFNFGENQDSIMIKGKKADVCALSKQLHDSASRVEKQILFEKSKVTKSIDLSDAQAELLSLCGFVEDLKSKYKDLEIEMKSGDHAIQMRGPEDVVNEGHLAVWQALAEMKENELKLDKSVIDILASESGLAFLTSMLNNNEVAAVVSRDSKMTEFNLVVTAVDRNTLKKALVLIQDVTTKESIPLDTNQKQLIDAEKWKELKDSIQKSILIKITEVSAENKLLMVGVKQEVDNAKEQIEDFFKNNIIMKKVEAEAEGSMIKDSIEQSLKNDSKLNVLEKRNGEERSSKKWVSHGTHTDEDRDTDIDSDISVDTFSDKDADINLNEEPDIRDFMSSNGEEDLFQFESKLEDENNSGDSESVEGSPTRNKEEEHMDKDNFKHLHLEDVGEIKVVQFHAKLTGRAEERSVGIEGRHSPISGKEEDFPEIQMSETRAAAMLPLSKTLDNGVVVSVHQGDITKVQVDVIVNAANERLDHGGGVSGAIVKQGGQQIQQESDIWVRLYGRVPVGEVACTGSGNLPYKHIYHAVGPQWRVHGGERSRQLIFEACMNSFNLASTQRISSIALPGISSGIFGVPKQICAEMMFTAAENFADKAPIDNQLKDIRFVNIDSPTYEAFRREFHNRYTLIKREVVDLEGYIYNKSAVPPSSEADKEKESQYEMTEGTNLVDEVEEVEHKDVEDAVTRLRRMLHYKATEAAGDEEKPQEHLYGKKGKWKRTMKKKKKKPERPPLSEA